MNNKLLKKYLEGLLQLDHLSDLMHDDLCDKLDKIWYSMSDDEHDYMNNLMENNKHLTPNTRIQNALDELNNDSKDE
jgi:hypothetical protein